MRLVVSESCRERKNGSQVVKEVEVQVGGRLTRVVIFYVGEMIPSCVVGSSDCLYRIHRIRWSAVWLARLVEFRAVGFSPEAESCVKKLRVGVSLGVLGKGVDETSLHIAIITKVFPHSSNERNAD